MTNNIFFQNQESFKYLKGSVERITFHNENTGFFVIKAKIKNHRNLITIIGSVPSIVLGEYIECVGIWMNDINHGIQFKANQIKTITPNTKEGIKKYLSSSIVKGVGPALANRLVDFFGDNIFYIIEKNPERLLELSGIGKKRQQQIATAWSEQKTVREIMIFLQSHGVGTNRAIRIYKTYGNKAIKKVKENPYQLALDVHGIGFKTADQIAHNIGIDSHAVIRAQAGIRHILQELSGQGHCAQEQETLINQTYKLLNIPKSIIQEAIQKELAERNIVAQSVEKNIWLFLTYLFFAEHGVMKNLKRLSSGIPPWGTLKLNNEISLIKKNNGIILSKSQQIAVEKTLENKITIITGGPGVGKTTIINSILNIVQTKKIQVILCAPTGRAAKKLSESTKQQATTIHRLLEFDPYQLDFKHNAINPLNVSLLIVDEASMIDIVIMNKLLRAIPDYAALLLVGDVDQLPSVGPGCVLYDIIKSKKIPVIQLTEIFRQKSCSNIITNAHIINAGYMPDITHKGVANDFFFISAETPEEMKNKLLNVILYWLPKKFGFNPIKDIQILTPMNKGITGAYYLNNIIQLHLNGDAKLKVTRYGRTFSLGDKIIQLINNYEKDVFNGDIGFIKSVDNFKNEIIVQFEDKKNIYYHFNELDELALAYVTTIHKSQGSEYPCVVITLSTQNYLILERNLIYTGVTRGKRAVVIMGQKNALSIAVKTQRSRKRKTWLQQRLSHW